MIVWDWKCCTRFCVAERSVSHRPAALVGGHTVRDTEIKYGLSVTGTVGRQQLLTNRGARPGDALVLTKELGTGFVTTANRAGKCPDSTLAAAVKSMIQLNNIGRDVGCLPLRTRPRM